LVPYANPAPGLVAGTTYYYCAIASNALGTSFGVIRMFTAPMPPTVATLAATPVTSTTATLNGSSNPNGNATIGWFRYSSSSPGTCNDVFGTRMPATGGMGLGSDVIVTPFAQPITGLAPATTYYFCAIASSAYGTTLGGVLSFTTPPATVATPGSAGPTTTAAAPVVTKDATAVAAGAAELNGTANPNGAATTGWFRYDTTDPGKCNDTFGTRAPTEAGVELGAGATPVAYSQTVIGLKAATTYYYCAIAASKVSSGFGAVLSLTTKAGPPGVTTAPPTEVTDDAAVLGGNVVPNGDATTAWFRYSAVNPGSCNDSFGDRVAAGDGKGLGAGVTAVPYAVAISGLEHGKKYYYCVIATNALGTSFGELVQLVAEASTLSVVTEAASGMDRTGATVAGKVEGSALTVWFRYGESEPGTCDDAFGSRAAAIGDPTLALVNEAGTYRVQLTGLKPSVTYYYCAAASNLGGAKFGQVRSFTTAAAAPVGTVSAAVEAVEPPSSGGCSYGARGGAGGPVLWLVSMLPLVGLAGLRRRRRR
jgi:hypothetical protein